MKQILTLAIIIIAGFLFSLMITWNLLGSPPPGTILIAGILILACVAFAILLFWVLRAFKLLE